MSSVGSVMKDEYGPGWVVPTLSGLKPFKWKGAAQNWAKEYLRIWADEIETYNKRIANKEIIHVRVLQAKYFRCPSCSRPKAATRMLGGWIHCESCGLKDRACFYIFKRINKR